MARVYHSFEVEDIKQIKQKMLSHANRFNISCFLDNQQYSSNNNSFECVLAVGQHKIFEPSADFFSSLSFFLESNPDWIFGHFNYEAGSNTEVGSNARSIDTNFPDCFLFVPEIVFLLKEDQLVIGSLQLDHSLVFTDLMSAGIPLITPQAVDFNKKISRSEYVESISQLKKHIRQGDCYEINFCQEFYAAAEIDPVSVFSRLIQVSPNPFSGFYRVNSNYLFCASPERYLKKTGNRIISQPIKGTSARSDSAAEDEVSKKKLMESSKDKIENVMIVDLVRNDLSKICEEGSVVAEELFGVYSFPHVHQMISTIAGVLKKDKDFSDVLKATFPMGSMTGAPKKRVMELIGKYEKGKRGIYSGTVGYFTPEKDFDFNVVIRSVVYNEKTKYLSFHTGSAITASSEPEIEYEECLLKGKAILKVFSGNPRADLGK